MALDLAALDVDVVSGRSHLRGLQMADLAKDSDADHIGRETFGTLCLTCSEELASGSRLARVLAGYMAVFWGVRVSLQAVFDVKEHLTTWWLRAGYHTLTLLFTSFTTLFAFVAARG